MEEHMTFLRQSIMELRTRAIIFGVVIIALLANFMTLARAGEINTGYFGKTAIMGYDPVAYFTMKSAVKGSQKYKLKWLGATWLFENEIHRKLFAENPISYAPQYGGHCSVGAAHGEITREIDPKVWSVIKGKLYLNYSKSATRELEENPDKIIAKADEKWPAIKTRLTQ